MAKITITAVRNFFKEKKPAFLFGNGINLYNNPSAKTWKNILQELLEKKVRGDRDMKKTFEKILQSDFSKDVTCPEMYDLINSLYKVSGPEKNKTNLQKESCRLIKRYFTKSAGNEHYKNIINVIKNKLNVPLLTTNFDGLFEQYCGITPNKENFKSLDSKIVGPGKYGSHFAYPWNKYFSKVSLKKPDDGFAIWHIHGTVAEPRSVQFGSNQYVGMCARAKDTFQNEKGQMSKSDEEWYGDNTWLDLFYNKNLVVIGLGLSTDESFLRWLFLGRSRHLTNFANKCSREEKHSLYLTTADNPVLLAQRLFLEICGFEIVELSSYKELYEDLWENWSDK